MDAGRTNAPYGRLFHSIVSVRANTSYWLMRVSARTNRRRRPALIFAAKSRDDCTKNRRRTQSSRLSACRVIATIRWRHKGNPSARIVQSVAQHLRYCPPFPPSNTVRRTLGPGRARSRHNDPSRMRASESRSERRSWVSCRPDRTRGAPGIASRLSDLRNKFRRCVVGFRPSRGWSKRQRRPIVGRRWSIIEVEARGIEPRSEARSTTSTTCVSL